ncbi:MAG TPA: endonuclease/exonuclease/phosphatase family protein, partial [Terrimesophilobacter sp.]|nr:endonuclease/exonuclease/phosphatase family protein [Terrimesophilobacter sp.]
MIRRTLAAVTLVLVALVLLVLAWPGLFGAEQWLGVAHIVSLRGLAAASAAVVVIVLLLMALASSAGRSFAASLALVLVLFIGLNAAVIANRGLGNGGFETKGPADLTVLTWNTLGDSPSAAEIAELILDTDADIVALPETTREHAAEIATILSRNNHPMWAHTFAGDEISKSRSTSLLTSADLGTYTFRTDSSPTRQFPTIVARPDSGAGPTIIAVHVVAPLPQYLDQWKSDLSTLATLCVGNVIMAGDFNATLDHFASLTDTP